MQFWDLSRAQKMETLFFVKHIQIRLEHISKHFYKQKMLSQVTFGGFPTSLINVSQFW